MTYRTILVYADAELDATARLKIAAALAALTGATLDGVFVKPLFLPPPIGADEAGVLPPTTLQMMVEGHLESVNKAVQTTQSRFRSTVEETGARAEWTTLEDGTVHGFIGMARCSDLVVFPKSGMPNPALSPTELCREAGPPVVLVPKSPRLGGEPGRRVLVAWNGSREAASALRGAWPILEAADRVEVLMVEPPPEAEAFMGERLDRRGVKAKIVIDRSPDAKAGEVIRRHAEELHANLVVMGLYGHARLREIILGGASKTMMEQETFPLLVAR
ncbi:MAG: UspA domain protein [Phenylobacterium sp.]|uniref:universal stress protein n=1 Tax=Phenylobacterium sp. TaxID=1871053 RepID=UPI002603ED89|nr:universal stress protein [Phenylobacterium sp.]MDB5433876.1 UspA domain protein [Phenylobacterium sp.]MDB5499106.1 UspA domain protein [Phenylobacterium sp.]